ncbi:alpha-mannosidase [Paenibacillus sp. GCM10027629]|uniref:alpha-mannosidase n=1 Tax=Paenibacillus sp. GCM10027629 TaxID=3273414 RepID=UPI0036307625
MERSQNDKPVFHVISHTHWDREWYLTFEQFRFRLVQLVDNLLELLTNDPNFNCFHLDAQTVILEDYLEIRPEKKEILERFIREGRILTGPWYVQNDVYLTSGESTVRNLMEGIRRSRMLEGEMKNGYFPDHFGIIGQIPQIMQGVGIDNVVFGRGYDIQLHGSPQLFWKAPDGSEVVGVFMPNWYNNAQRFPVERDDLLNTFEMIKDKELLYNKLPHHLLMNGVDHLEAQENLTEALDKLRQHYGDQYSIEHSTLPHYTKLVREKMLQAPDSYPVIHHELREGNDQSVLASTLSSRLYIKQADARCHDLIEKWLEPISSWCKMLDLDPYDYDYMNYLWKLWMKNHPHDSICGCSTDGVHDHMMERYASITEAGEALLEQKLDVLAHQVDNRAFGINDQKLFLANTSQLQAEDVVQTELYFHADDDVQQFAIEDHNGISIPYRIVAEQDSRIRTLSPINLPLGIDCRKYVIEWQPTVPALGYSTYVVRPHQVGIVIPDQEQASHVLENDYIHVQFASDGTFDVTDKTTGHLYKQLGRWEEQGDQGNLYVFRAAGEAQTYQGTVEYNPVCSNALYEEISYSFTWELPAQLDMKTRTRTSEVEACTFTVHFRLERESKQLKIRVQIDNQVTNHRIRYVLPLAEAMQESLAGGQYDIVRRVPGVDAQWQRNSYIHPFWKLIAADQGSKGVACYAPGLHEYEMADEGKQLAITLIRGVGSIHFADIPLDVDHQIKGQCLGKNEFELAIRPFGCESATELYMEAELFHQGLKQRTMPIDELKWSTGRPWVQDSNISSQFTRPDPNANKPQLAMTNPVMSMSGNVIVSAVKGAEGRNGIVIRCYNAEESCGSIDIQFPMRLAECFKTDLLEQALCPVEFEKNHVQYNLGAKKIDTIRVSWGSRES